jgi:hypothetical protein
MLWILIWNIKLQYSTRSLKHAIQPVLLLGADHNLSLVPNSIAARFNQTITTHSTGDMLFMRKLAPIDYRPTNAHFRNSSYHLSQPFANDTTVSTLDRPSPSSQGKRLSNQVQAESTGDVKVPSESDETSHTVPPQGRDFSGLARGVPVSCETLKKQGILDRDGSPTRKWIASERLCRRLSEKDVRSV